MINSAVNLQISQLLDMYGNVVYFVPRFQREYTWEKKQWDEFFDDILANDAGHFLGSMICINRGMNVFGIQELELVDGQQRMTTISLMLAAIYSNQKDENLKWMLVQRMNEDEPRLIPQISNDNQKDYLTVLCVAGILKSYNNLLQNAESRSIFRAYQHFLNRFNKLSEEQENKKKLIMEVHDKILRATLVIIQVSSTSDACKLFESLNNRGTPLSAVDLIKNKLFASLDETEIDLIYENWNSLLKLLGDDYKVQERFFRQYYNAFRKTLLNEKERKEINKNISVATKSNIIQIYEKLIKKDHQDFLRKIIEAGKLYSIILGLTNHKNYLYLKNPLLDLGRIQGTPSYLLLLYLIQNKDQLKLKEEHLVDIIEFLGRFFVRRNLTDRPATNSLTPLFMKIVDEISSFSGDGVVEKIKYELVSVSSKDEEFRKSLEGPIYSESSSVARFILCAIEDRTWPSKIPIDLWAIGENGKIIWTIEHILPQGVPLLPGWEKMIADGDEAKAKEMQVEHVHRLGNLTLTVYNSELGKMSFREKRDRKDKDDKYIGYKSDLHLNDDIRDLDKWTVEYIEKRTAQLVYKTLELFPLNDGNV